MFFFSILFPFLFALTSHVANYGFKHENSREKQFSSILSTSVEEEKNLTTLIGADLIIVKRVACVNIFEKRGQF